MAHEIAGWGGGISKMCQFCHLIGLCCLHDGRLEGEREEGKSLALEERSVEEAFDQGAK